MPLPGRRLDNIIHPQDHLCRLRGRDKDLELALEGLPDAQHTHISNPTIGHVEAERGMPCRMCSTQLGDELAVVNVCVCVCVYFLGG